MPSGAPSDRSQKKASPPTHDAGTVSGDRAADASIPDLVTTPASQPLDLLSLLRPPQADGELGRLGGFRIVRVLGQGGMGAVFEAHDPVVRRKVALKVMKPEMTARPESYQRFLREARSAAAVDHDHIIPVYQVGQDKGVLFIAMPLLKGESLHQRLQREPRLPIAAILKLGQETAEGLAAAHACDLIHRDIKPGNLWLEGSDECGDFRRMKILDFGLARAVHEDTHLTAAGGVLGTPAYMAPEQAAGEEVDHRADLFSLGAVLYRCCTGKLPFSGPNSIAILSALANKTPAPVREQNPEVPPALADLIMRMLAKAPADRLQSAQEVAETLRRIEQEYTVPSPGKHSKRRRSPLKAACIASVLGLGLLAPAGLIVVKVRSPDGKETEVMPPEGIGFTIDARGNITAVLPADKPPAPAGQSTPNAPAKEANSLELEWKLTAGSSRVFCLVITADGKNVIAGYGEGCLRVWDLRKRKVVRTHTTGSHLRGLALHPDGKTLAVSCEDGTLFTWDRTTGEVVRRFTGYPGGYGLCFARGGQFLVTPDDNTKAVLCWETATGNHRVLAHWPKEADHGYVQAAPDGEQVALVPMGAPVQFLDLSSGKPLWVSRCEGGIAAPVFTSDGKKWASAGWRSIWIWDLKSGRPESMSQSPASVFGATSSEVIGGLAISPENRFLAAACGGRHPQVQLYDLTGPPYPLRVWEGPAPHRVAFTPDGRRLLSAHEDGAICVFTVPQDLPVWRGFPPLDPAWLARTTELSADEQVKEVAAELTRRNPGFNDPLHIEKDGDGQVRGIGVQTTQLEDLSPFHGFPALRALMVEPKEGIGKVWDLSCLREMRLTYLGLRSNHVFDLSPLRDMPLTTLLLDSNPLYDLSPLRAMRLSKVGLCSTNVDDVSCLKGMPLESIWLHSTPIKDLSPLSKAPLKFISTNALDLTPLCDLPFEGIELHGDYKPEQIKTILRIPTLKEMSLVDSKYTPEQLKEFRGNPILKTINGKPAAEFWKAAEKLTPVKKDETPGNG